VLADREVAKSFAEVIVATATTMLGDEVMQKGETIPKAVRFYGRIVNERNLLRLKEMLNEDHGGKVLMGGVAGIDIAARFMSFTVVLNPKKRSLLMREEIFGPILVICAVDDVDDAIATMTSICETPLAAYIFAEDRMYIDKVLDSTTAGSVGINSHNQRADVRRHDALWRRRPVGVRRLPRQDGL
jgi:aldehyde dehydrogenase (NAD+)